MVKEEKISSATMYRIPAYLRYLKDKQSEGQEYITTVEIGRKMNINAILVKYDLSFITSSEGRPKVGFKICDLILDIEKFLGYDNITKAVLVGAGQLGKTLLTYDGFENYALNIVAAFDNDPCIMGTTIKNKTVFDICDLGEYVKSNGILLGIVTVPRAFAQNVCNLMVEAGIKAIWNFAPVSLKVPQDVILKNEDIAASLAVLSVQLKR